MLSALENYRSADIAFQSALIHLQMLEDIATAKRRAYAALVRSGADADTVYKARLDMLDADRAADTVRREAEEAQKVWARMVRYS